MLKLKWMVICQRVILDQGKNLVSLIDCVDSITINKKEGETAEIEYPVNIPIDFSVVMNWDREIEDSAKFNGRIRGLSTDDSEYVSVDFDMDFESKEAVVLAHRTIVNVPGIVVHGPGLIRFIVEAELDGNWVPCGEQFLRVSINF